MKATITTMGSTSGNRERAQLLPDFVQVGLVGRPHGIHGAVTVEVHSDVADRFAAGKTFRLITIDGATSTVCITSSKPYKGGALVCFAGCESRDQAVAFRGARLEVPRSQVPPAPAGSYYFFELIGCHCRDARHGDLGTVAHLLEDGGGLLLEIEQQGRASLVPFVDAFLEDVDVERRSIALRLPKGLIEACTVETEPRGRESGASELCTSRS